MRTGAHLRDYLYCLQALPVLPRSIPQVQEELGLVIRPVAETLRDMALSLISHGIAQPKVTPQPH